MIPHPSNLRSAYLALALAIVSPGAFAQITTFVNPSFPGDGTIWAQAIGIKQSSGSAELGTLDMGPPGPPVSGIQDAWLEWNPQHVYCGGLSSGSVFANEVFQPASGLPIAPCVGVATLNGGWIVTNNAGTPIAVSPFLGSFLWTPTKLYVLAHTGPLTTAEILDPSGGPIANIQGVVILHSYIWDYSTTPGSVQPAIEATALVYTPTHLYQVLVQVSGAPFYSCSEVFDTLGAPITLTRGISVVAGSPDTSSFPPFDVQGAAFIWNPSHVFLFTKTPFPAIAEVFNTFGSPITGCWGVMKMGPGMTNPTRAAAQIWQTSRAWLVVLDPLINVTEATMPPGTPADPPIFSGVSVPAGGSPLIERQASFLYEIMGSITVGSALKRALICGHGQRSR